MGVLWVVLAVAWLVSAGGAVVWIRRCRRPGWFHSVLKRRMLVHTKAGKSFEGLLAEVVPDGIVLQQAKLLNGTGDGLPMVGGCFVPRSEVLFAQLIDS